MNDTIIVDACSFINFLSVNEHNILIQFATIHEASLLVSMTVANEIERVTNTQTGKYSYRYTGAWSSWQKIKDKFVTIYDDKFDLVQNAEYSKALVDLHRYDIAQKTELASRLNNRENLGEFVSIGYCLYLARQGYKVIFIIDDAEGRQIFKHAQQILQRDGIDKRNLRLASTRSILNIAEKAWLKKNSKTEILSAMEKINPIPDWS
ncbi:hypothetical protein SAMN04489737_0412 [Arcanobacterium phocae]|uniref:PIN domain-containing protein n=1 Tax=Arcanobacterium phocae TaxID=131112 RepID=A0A1H2LBV6_9ACTO|nr:hypothetical protein [Arcanobacterium phocae]SDU78294.1 hypothetical protein SAMN04489737_0412 [Arcanobacterium phocae]